MLFIDGNKTEDQEIGKAEEFIREGEYEKSMEILERLVVEKPDNGRVWFDLGTVALMNDKEKIAVGFFEKAIEKNYQSYDVYTNLGLCRERLKKFKQAENAFDEAIKVAEEPEERWAVYNNQCLFYYRNGMLLKAKTLADKAVEILPEEYQSYHLKYLVYLKRKNYSEIEVMFQNIREKFSDEPQYLIDRIAYLEDQGKYTEEIKILEEDSNYMEVIPEDTLRKKIRLYLQRKKNEKAIALIYELFNDYGDLEAGYSVMVYEIMNEKYLEAGKTGNAIMTHYMESMEKPDSIFYHTMYLEVIVLNKLFGNNAPEEVRQKLISMTESYENWLKENGISTEEMEKKISIVKETLSQNGEINGRKSTSE